ncbi:peamaclein [Oryza sativa Japonica Group]|jgi:hypothetical protein|uniref:OSJNBa0060P14.17 protein n=8 Tax=Oryza TaxID=4527 RepID=Q0JCJ9_ORYSJ|nr:gibberellin-regulated protein 14 [Oryza sativa Japonica Group]XP_052153124.1 gibberellin-regulated protein 14-like [Oryza glaberrima]KAB8095669.1 hypothetical protein EE612_023814 [Oryza sativa]KAF2934393.1 hypothetical protein DAI22_04g159200 [Oryza sativa Japonica Group]CAD40932.1 OSJNBb0048E02.8 [Oryza sativa Japonica Group]CAE04364.1 OSJNBa0060P14.17 [Oryza sativa Japonica Group]CAH67142.1 OSIGBa0130P02.6 [Oryza sativa]|eukprot:NP_001053024.1 Os04g0465300 [Oryza sativa Japonica Group]
MAPGKLAVFALLASLLLLNTIKAADYPPAPPLGPPPHKIVDPGKDCVGACDARCSEHSHKKRCSRSCLTCCSACRCVPAGTAGNRETCGRCYTDWVSHNNMTKCP